jgi:hypothetical protein
MITGDKNFSKLTSESPETPVSPVSLVSPNNHPVGVEWVAPSPLSGKQGLLDVLVAPEPPVSRVAHSSAAGSSQNDFTVPLIPSHEAREGTLSSPLMGEDQGEGE